VDGLGPHLYAEDLPGDRYNAPDMSSWRRTHLIALAVFVAAFVALYPYLDSAGYCAESWCPEMSQASQAASTGFSATCLVVAVLVIYSPAVRAFAAPRRRRAANQSRPAEPHLSPDPPPPRPFPGR
jgi:hypothetical protein